ncbi:hypothetical protein Pla123a_24920 [Posidoniimonas polymericola]|uniref:HEAT repeat protein n=1 Tax=Posidoniimonas polymericola TaxID=2528002 RepID=A0A5C5YQ25_9BACT|nr:HEAT repeat domain-containing protein [Posidoniimonas polymericola]TWT77062.1 hypothetical protein Pla123a_24920 [Posidoniimonas polymericola]
MSEQRPPSKLPRLAVLACGVLMVLAGWEVSRRFVAHGIATRAECNPSNSRAAISELAQLGPSAVPALLDAAVSDDREVAVPARAQVEALLDDWAYSRPAAFEDRCLALIEGVADREPQLTPSGRVWARRLGDHALRKLNASRSSGDGYLIMAVERLYALADQPPQYIDQPLRVRRISPVEIAQSPGGALQPAPAFKAPIAPPKPLVAAAAPESPSLPDPRPIEAAPAAPISPVEQPIARGPAPLDWREPTPDPSEAAEPQRLPSDTTADGPIGNVAATPPGLPTEVTSLLEGTPVDRLRLVEQLLTGRHENAAEILLRLARDPEPKVRLSAISALGSSTNPQLTEAAYQLAVHDEDPKVSRLATELQKLLR